MRMSPPFRRDPPDEAAQDRECGPGVVFRGLFGGRAAARSAAGVADGCSIPAR